MKRPEPPYLVIRPGLAFWVSDRPIDDCSARLQAFGEGCYRDALCVDTMGGVWPIVEARLKHNPSLLDRLLLSAWVAVELELGPRRNASPGEVAAWLTDVLRNGPEFSEHLTTSLEALRRRFETASSTEDLIRIAGEVSRDRR